MYYLFIVRSLQMSKEEILASIDNAKEMLHNLHLSKHTEEEQKEVNPTQHEGGSTEKEDKME